MDIIKYPNPVLREKSQAVRLPLSKDDRVLLDSMFAWLKENGETAVGLSAVQVGVLKRMCVIRFAAGDKTVSYKLVNPMIVRRSSDKVAAAEGCLSVPEDHDDPIMRSRSVSVMAFDAIQNKNITIQASGFLARVLQHEIDHMNGKLYIDYIKENR